MVFTLIVGEVSQFRRISEKERCRVFRSGCGHVMNGAVSAEFAAILRLVRSAGHLSSRRANLEYLIERATVNVNATDVETLARPLVVDVDGTLIRSDLLIESAFAYLAANTGRAFTLPSLALAGKAQLKAHIAARTSINPAHLPYNEQVLGLVREARNSGRPVFLASASNERYIQSIAEHLGLFEGWFASNDTENLKAERKAKRLRAAFGENGFDYVGNSRADLPVWSIANKRVAVDPPYRVKTALKSMDSDVEVLTLPHHGLRDWLRLFRVHQWTKNALVFVPIFAAHKFNFETVVSAMMAAVAFSLAASSIYTINDLVDVDEDRKHRTKRLRPLASGLIDARHAIAVASLLLVLSLAIAFTISPLFAASLVGYLALTTAYSFYIKRKMMADIVALASLYTLRVIGGAIAIRAMPSEWILAFSMFIFTSLALIKRYVELTGRLDASLPDPANRNYRKSDLVVIAALAAATGLNAVTVFALYISSDAVHPLYRHPAILWLVCPILLYWIGRTIILADRRRVNDDPVVFALRDRNSLLAFAAIGLIMFAAT
jgi:4-hydroxybenzoate polyprenyltransferase/phosphoserine phosphatase